MSGHSNSSLNHLVIEDIIKSLSSCEIDPEVLHNLETIWKSKYSQACAREASCSDQILAPRTADKIGIWFSTF